LKVNTFEFDYSKQREFKFFFSSDHHMMSDDFDNDRFQYEFNFAKQQGCYFINGGDWGEFITVRDKRYRKSRDICKTEGQINETIDEAVDKFTPYADRILIQSSGNHEMTILANNAIDPTSMLIRDLNRIGNRIDNPIKHGSYSGFILFRFYWGEPGNASVRYTVYYNHGTGGSPEVSKGTIDAERRKYIDADLIWTQHIHKKLNGYNDTKIGIDRNGNYYEREQKFIISGAYKKNVNLEEDGVVKNIYSEQKCRTSQAKGGSILTIDIESSTTIHSRIEML